MAAASAAEAGEYSLEVVAREGGPAPLGETFQEVFSGYAALNDAGAVGFAGATDTTSYVLVHESDASLSVRATRGDTAPGTGGSSFVDFSDVTLNDAGEVAFYATTDDVPPSAGFFRESAGSVSAVALDGDPAPDLAPATYVLGTTVVGFGPSIANNGDVAFYSQLSTSTLEGLFLDSAGTDSKIVARGDGAPGTGGNSFLSVSAVPPFLSDVGHVIFWGRLTSGGLDGIFSASAGSLVPLVLEGDPSPVGGSFGPLGRPRTNASGQAVFFSEEALFVSSGGAEELIVSSGDPVPGGTHDLSVQYVSINDLGDVAFISLVGGNQVAYVYRASTGAITRVAQKGDPLPGEAGKTLGTLLRISSINRQRQVALLAGLVDDPLPPVRAVFLASPPEYLPALGPRPGAILVGLLAIAGALVVGRLRRRAPA